MTKLSCAQHLGCQILDTLVNSGVKSGPATVSVISGDARSSGLRVPVSPSPKLLVYLSSGIGRTTSVWELGDSALKILSSKSW